MTKLSFTKAAQALGINTLGGIGTKWCDIDPDGVMVLMAHSSYFKKFKKDGKTLVKYIDPGSDKANKYGPAIRSLDALGDYYSPGREILLIEAEFKTDGSPSESAEFDYATGVIFRAKFEDFDRLQGRIVCHVYDKFQIS